MDVMAKRCDSCGGLMEVRLGSWECQKCGHREFAKSDTGKVKRRKGARSTPTSKSQGSSALGDWKKEHGTSLLDFSKGTGREQELQSASQQQPQGEYQTIQEFTKREQKKPKYYVESGSSETDGREAEKKLAAEKLIYFGLWLLLSCYVCYLVYSVVSQGLFSIDFQLHEVIYISVFCMAVMIGIMWYTLYCESPELKWICVILGWIIAFGQAVFFFVIFTTESVVDNLTFDSGYSGMIGMIAAAVLTVAWTCWYIYILYRDIQRMQS